MERRDFLAAGSAAFLLRSETVRGAAANSALRLGMIGCGSRGRAVATAFVEATNTRMVAMADLFEDQLASARQHFDSIAQKKGYAGIDSKRLFRGPQAFQELAHCKDVDVVLISSPDYFHPEHLAAVIDAGKHVYCEKPAAVDVQGCKRFADLGRRAEGKLSMAVGFNVRYGPAFSELVRRVHAGGIGQIASAAAHYHAPAINYPARTSGSALERRIRNFYWDRVLSGDILVDQNIHMIDVFNWMLKSRPLKAVGTGGRKVRREGDIWDHFAILFTYPGNVHATFNSVQFGDRFWDVGVRVLGDKGVGEAYYSGMARIVGEASWYRQPTVNRPESGGFSTIGLFNGLENAERLKTTNFVESITSGTFINESAIGAESALSAILGRMAAYSGREVTWEEMLASNQSYEGAVDWSRL